MKLDAYLETTGKTATQFAKEIGRSEATVSRLRRGLHQPDWETVAAITAATKGAVTANDFALTAGEAA